MISVSRWSVKDGDYRIRFSEGVPGALSIEHFYLEKNNKKSITKGLSLVSGSEYSYSIPSIVLLDSFRVYRDGVLFYRYDGGDDSRDSLSGSDDYLGIEALPVTEIENRVPEIVDWVYWRHNSDIYYSIVGKYSSSRDPVVCRVATLFPSFKYVMEVDPQYRLPGSFSPRSIDSKGLEDMLSDPEGLFDGESGEFFILEERGKVVVPYSDGVVTWKDEFDIDDFYDVDYNIGRPQADSSSIEDSYYIRGEPYWKKNSVAMDWNYNRSSDASVGDVPAAFYNFISPYNTLVSESMGNSLFGLNIGWDVFGADPLPLSSDIVINASTFLAWPSIGYSSFGGL